MGRCFRDGFRRDQSGVAMASALLAIFILTIVAASLVLASMGETSISASHIRSVQAFQLAEAGAYRALAELRKRISVDFDSNIRSASRAEVANACASGRGWTLITTYADPLPAQELGTVRWVNGQDSDRFTSLAIGSSTSPIEVRDASGQLIGSFYATIYVRPDGTPNRCFDPGPNRPESYAMNFDHFIVATGIVRDAQRTICLKNSFNRANCGNWLASSAKAGASWDSRNGWELVVGEAAYSRWALMLLAPPAGPGTFLFTGASYAGPVHSNGALAFWGTPTFTDSVTQVESQAWFGNGGSPLALADYHNPPRDEPNYAPERRLQRGVDPIPRPRNHNPFWAVLGNENCLADGSCEMPTDRQIREQISELQPNDKRVPDGIYFVDGGRRSGGCGQFTCGGIFVQGHVTRLQLVVDGNRQVIFIDTAGDRSRKISLLDSVVRVCDGPDPYTVCRDVNHGFNGMIFVNGNVTAAGLHGVVDADTRLTVAADGEIRITDNLVYENPPTGSRDSVPNILGLYAWCSNPRLDNSCPETPQHGPRNVTVDGAMTPGCEGDPCPGLTIHAAVLAPWGQFWVEGYDTLPEKGTLHLLGGTVQARFGPWGSFVTDSNGNVLDTRGYAREMTYDPRFLVNFAPPFFPYTGIYTAPRFGPLQPVDTLYDRPIWEELVRRP